MTSQPFIWNAYKLFTFAHLKLILIIFVKSCPFLVCDCTICKNMLSELSATIFYMFQLIYSFGAVYCYFYYFYYFNFLIRCFRFFSEHPLMDFPDWVRKSADLYIQDGFFVQIDVNALQSLGWFNVGSTLQRVGQREYNIESVSLICWKLQWERTVIVRWAYSAVRI